jgi:hypothetical protein
MGILLSKGIDKVIIDPETGQEIIILGKSIFIKGTDIELTNCYVRIEFTAQKDGRTCDVIFSTYLNYEKFKEGKVVETSITTNKFDFAILETELQSIDVVLQYSIEKFEDLGYTAEIEP